MKNPLKTPFAIGRIAAAALLVAATSAHAATGAKVVVQEWSPLQPDRLGGRVLVDDPDVVSRSIQQAWTTARGMICSQLVAKMGASKAAAGQTLRDIDCHLDENPAFTVSSAGPNALHVVFSIRGNSITATSTVPDPFTFDPRFSLVLDAKLDVAIAVQSDAARTLRATNAVFSLGGASVDSHNLSGDILKFIADDLVPFFGGPNFKKLAENAVNGISVNLTSTVDSKLAPVNALLRGPAGMAQLKVWAGPNRIAIAYGPRPLTPPGGGTISGVVRWDPAQFTAAPNCQSFDLQATVQTGPGMLRTPDDFTNVDEAPMQNVGHVSMTPSGDRECRYTITNAAAGWPNRIAATIRGGVAKQASNTFITKHAVLQADGWNGVAVASASDRNYHVATGVTSNPVAKVQTKPGDPIGPVARPGDVVSNPGVLAQNVGGTKVVTGSALGNQAVNIRPVGTGTAAVVQPGQAVTLNPQPLPPKWGAVGVQPGAAVSLNPQPLPPKAGVAVMSSGLSNGVDARQIPSSAFGR